MMQQTSFCQISCPILRPLGLEWFNVVVDAVLYSPSLYGTYTIALSKIFRGQTTPSKDGIIRLIFVLPLPTQRSVDCPGASACPHSSTAIKEEVPGDE